VNGGFSAAARRRRGPRFNASPSSGAFLRTAQLLNDRLESAFREVGLSRAKLVLLRHLVEAVDPVPLRVLAETQQCVPSNITALIDRLEAEGLVRRVDDPADRRSRLAELTDVGRDRAAAGAVVVDAVVDEFKATLSPAEADALAGALAALRTGWFFFARKPSPMNH
jgi:DNA-binding MarR family transcriptional regulator